MTLTPSDGLREGWGAEKSRVVTWRDPAPTAAIAASIDGWEFVQAIMDHRLPSPPIQQLMQFELVSVEPGRTVFTCAPDESAYNAIGAVCGALISTEVKPLPFGMALCSAAPTAVSRSVQIRPELPQGSSTFQRSTNGHGNSGQVRVTCGFHRRHGDRCLRCAGGHGIEHLARHRPCTPGSYLTIGAAGRLSRRGDRCRALPGVGR
jgi:hypothetical protein